MTEPPAAQPSRPPDDEGGDPACWLQWVCPECGRFVEQRPPATCPRCGATVGDT